MRIKVVACGVFEPELTELAQQVENELELHFLDAGLHERPDSLRSQLQQAIDEAEGRGYDAIVAGYGLCGRGTSGIVARSIPVVLLRVHDCITLFLGSRAAYMEQFSKHPGTFYITPGWYEKQARAGKDALTDKQAAQEVEDDPRFAEWAERFGEDAAAHEAATEHVLGDAGAKPVGSAAPDEGDGDVTEDLVAATDGAAVPLRWAGVECGQDLDPECAVVALLTQEGGQLCVGNDADAVRPAANDPTGAQLGDDLLALHELEEPLRR